MKVAIIDYGAGNVFSVKQALTRLGTDVVLTADPDKIRAASHVIFPGVGHAKPAMEQLKVCGLDQVIPALTQPVLGICLGMQLMCAHTEEGNTAGLRIFSAEVKKMEAFYPIPHMGWNDVKSGENSTAYYFVHSYAAEICPETCGVTTYPNPFSALLKKNNFTGVQFHPEKSGKAGAELLRQFLES
ncbi:imidazole glycerol phosphate synthase subunit HisH [Fluviicola sp.]|uniref:imidazole glycerol phosphate synthase subunit HisH n=1 Tax=Fluviicola sp. TaxID=1917219 RepID=UPI0031D6D1E7